MDVKQLAALAAVADHGGFSAAARSLHTVQSNVSAHVARLERELGGPLVNRSNGELTEAGTIVVERFRRIQAEIDAIANDVAATMGEVSGVVHLGVIGTIGRWLVPTLLKEMAAAHPKVRLVIIDATTTSLVPQLASGRLDLAVVNLPVEDPDITSATLFLEDHLVVVPELHPLSGRTDLVELSGYPLLLEPPGTGFRDDLDDDAARAGVVLHAAAEVDGLRLVASIAFEGQMAAVLPASALPESVASNPARSWRRVELDGVTPRRVGLATARRTQLSAPARAVHDVVMRVATLEAPRRPGLRVLYDHS